MTAFSGVVMATLVLRGDNLNKYRRLAGLETDASLARRIGVDPTTVYRVLNGRTAPSARFIAGIVATFGVDLFPDLFEVVPDGAPASPARARVAHNKNEPARCATTGTGPGSEPPALPQKGPHHGQL